MTSHDDRRRLERPFGWAFHQLHVLKKEAWLLAQELWMISGHDWFYAAPFFERVDRSPAGQLAHFAAVDPEYLFPSVMEFLRTNNSRAIATLTNLKNLRELEFVDERQLLQRLTTLDLHLGHILDILTRMPESPREESLWDVLQHLAEQELAQPHRPRSPPPRLSLAPARPSLFRMSRDAAWRSWADIQGRLRILNQARILDPDLDPAVLKAITLTRWGNPGSPEQMNDLDLSLQKLRSSLSNPADAWFYSTAERVIQEYIELYPLAARHMFEHVIAHQDDEFPKEPNFRFGASILAPQGDEHLFQEIVGTSARAALADYQRALS